MTATDQLLAALSDRYRIEREIGRGGMATVYLAEDVRHRRRVAVKVLHPELSAVIGPERFLKEIELTASLQHPHILPLFDSGNANGLLYYVMPYVEGETLRTRLERERQLSVVDAVRIATEVASALEYAHTRRVVHRDVKPENILLQSGGALVADFGIALAVQSAGDERMTQTGLSLGTPQYMAPEQATGERGIDHRADIYALGAVTYEMLAGQPPFTGPTAQSIVAKVMTEDAAPLVDQRRSVPLAVDAAVLRALEKLPADRWPTAQAFATALASTDSQPVVGRAMRASAGRQRQVVAAWSITALACAIAAWAWLRRGDRDVATPASRLSVIVPGGTSFPGGTRLMDMTADGSRIVYYSSTTTGSVVQLRDLDGSEARPIKGTEGTVDLHLTPDGRSLYFGDAGTGKMSRITLAGGTPVPMPGVPSPLFLALSNDGSVWSSTVNGAVTQTGPDGVARPRFTGDTLIDRLAFLQILPGGREALVKEFRNNEGPLYALNLTTGATTKLTDVKICEARVAAGYLVYVTNDGRMSAVQYDVDRHKVIGTAVQIADSVSLSGVGIAQFAVADNGTIAYVPAQSRELVLVDRRGARRPVVSEQQNFHQPRFSPDGKSIVVDFATPDGRDVWMVDPAAKTIAQVTRDRDGHDASWAPDGKSIIYASEKGGVYSVLRTRPGSGKTDLVYADNGLSSWPGRWMPDGKRILTIATNIQGNSGTDIVLVDSARRITPLVVTPNEERWTDISPDGRWLTYTSDLSGQFEVYVRALTGGDPVQVSSNGATEPMWSRDGRELFYRAASGPHQVMMSASIQTSPSLAVTSRKSLFTIDDYDPAQPHSNYDVSPDGQSFLMVHRGPVGQIIVIQNLRALVQRLQGAKAP